MSLKSFKPVTPSNRYKVWPSFDEITTSTPEKSLCRPLKKSGGRNNNGRITTRHIGGGHKRKYRLVDFKRNKFDVPATVLTIEYDPNRTCRIALIEYKDGEKSYILAPTGLQVGMKVESGQKVAPKVGNAMPLKNVPLGTSVHNIETANFTGRHLDQRVTRFTVGNDGLLAGRTRWMGVRPTVRGMTMNPVDHPNGGGEGKSKSGGGRQHLKSPWGHVKGQKTRRLRKPSDSVIVQRRNAK